jgi:parallel beta-helix repeat protein
LSITIACTARLGTLAMGFEVTMRRMSVLLLSCAVLAGCGSSSSSSDATPTRRPAATRTPGGPTRTPRPTETPGGPTRTPTRTRTPAPPQTLYVRTTGNDDNAGTSPDQALLTVAKAVERMSGGTTIYVGPGHYRGRVEITNVDGRMGAPGELIADASGTHTGDRPGEVILDADGDVVALVVTRSPYVTIDGFLITGARPQTDPRRTATGVNVRTNSHHLTFRNCIIGNVVTADGIRIDASSDSLIFNNLIFENDRGIVISGASQHARIINNTIASQDRVAILLGANDGAAPTNATVTNNIIQTNANNVAIRVDVGPPNSFPGYAGNYNLVFEPDAEDQTASYVPTTIRGVNDINADAQFVNLPQGDVHLEPTSPALNAGSASIGTELVAELLKRSTTDDGAADRAPVDLGYHYAR